MPARMSTTEMVASDGSVHIKGGDAEDVVKVLLDAIRDDAAAVLGDDPAMTAT